MAFTERQRRWIKERDNNTSQLRTYSEEQGFHIKDPTQCKDCDGKGCPLQVHHIDTQRNGGGDTPDNGITLYECQHNGRKPHGKFADTSQEFVVHPDMIPTFQRYRDGDKKAFEELQEERNKKVKGGNLYHNTDHDAEMFETAKERTDNFVARGNMWPFKKK